MDDNIFEDQPLTPLQEMFDHDLDGKLNPSEKWNYDVYCGHMGFGPLKWYVEEEKRIFGWGKNQSEDDSIHEQTDKQKELQVKTEGRITFKDRLSFAAGFLIVHGLFMVFLVLLLFLAFKLIDFGIL